MHMVYTVNRSVFGLFMCCVILASNAFSLYGTEESETEHTERTPQQNVLAFGARGNGTHDDAEAIQQAVNSQIGTILFPRGTYRISQSIIIDLDRYGPVALKGEGTAKLIMEGTGPLFRFIGTHQGTANPASVKDNVWERQRMPLIDGLELVGKHPGAVGIEASGTMQMTCTRLLIRHMLHAIHLKERNRNVVLSECHIYENSGIGIYLDHINLHQINITNCHISYNGGGGIVARPGNIRNLQITGCDIEGNMNPDGPLTANVLIDNSEGNSIGEGAIVGCTLQHTRNAPGSANIRFIGPENSDDSFIENFTIADNVLSDVMVNIELQGARGITITGNTLWQGYDRDLLVDNCSNIIVANNVFDRNPHYRETDSRRGLLFRNSTDCILNGLQILHPMQKEGGLVLEQCERINITGCSIADSDGCGILLADVKHIRISDCLITDIRPGTGKPAAIRLLSGMENMIEGNMLHSNMEITEGTARVGDNYIIQNVR